MALKIEDGGERERTSGISQDSSITQLCDFGEDI